MSARRGAPRGRPWDPRVPHLADVLTEVAEGWGAASGPADSMSGLRIVGSLGDLVGPDDRPADLSGCVLSRVRVPGAEVDHWRLRDVELDVCDFAGVVGRDMTFDAVAFRGGRLTGCAWVGGLLRDVSFTATNGPDLSLRFGRLQRVVFDACLLRGLDLTEAELDHVTFRGCDLTGAHFTAARVRAARFIGCELAGADGVEGLAGSHIDVAGLPAMGPSLASALGLTVGSADALEALAT